MKDELLSEYENNVTLNNSFNDRGTFGAG